MLLVALDVALVLFGEGGEETVAYLLLHSQLQVLVQVVFDLDVVSMILSTHSIILGQSPQNLVHLAPILIDINFVHLNGLNPLERLLHKLIIAILDLLELLDLPRILLNLSLAVPADPLNVSN